MAVSSGKTRRPGATFFARDPQPAQRPVHRRGAAGDPAGPGQLLQGRVGLGGEGLAEPADGLAPEGRGLPAAAGPRGDRPGLASPLQQASYPGLADAETLGDLGASIGPVVAGGDDPLA